LKKALFLDRDGVINEDTGYVHTPEAFVFRNGVFEFLRAVQDRGYLLVIVTNQAGIAKGYYTEEDFLSLTAWMKDEFALERIELTGVYYCPNHPEGVLPQYACVSDCRKPAPGMILKATAELNIDLTTSAILGDKGEDMEAGRRAGVGHLLFLPGNYPYETEPDVTICAGYNDALAKLVDQP